MSKRNLSSLEVRSIIQSFEKKSRIEKRRMIINNFVFKHLQLKNNNNSNEISQMIKSAFVPSADWGPKNSKELASWREFKEMRRKIREKRQCSKFKQFVYVILCWEDKL